MEAGGAKRYNFVKYSLAFAEIVYLLVLLAVFIRSGWSFQLARMLEAPFGAFTPAVYILIASSLYYIANFPLTVYRSFFLEHRFGLSAQDFKSWGKDQAKGAAVAYVLSVVLFYAFYWAVHSFPAHWWAVVSLLWLVFNILLTRLAPVVILPLFFKYKPVTDEALRSRIAALADKMELKLLGVFEIDMSAKTVKANAGLMGWGKSRRVVLGDTLKEKYTPDEIEVILAHEFAHQKLRHLPALILLNAFSAAACFYLLFATGPRVLAACGLPGMGDISSLALVVAYFVLGGFCMQPLLNYLSRRMERDADMLALKTTGMTGAFVSTMHKLGAQNLSDDDPGALIKFFFFDHPPLRERVAYAS